MTLLVQSFSTLLIFTPAGDTDVAAAAEAFSHAQRAELGREHARAAEFYELADSLSPSPEALRSAAKNRFSAGQQAAAATLAAALLRRYPTEENKELADAILESASEELAFVTATCDEPCVLASNGVAVANDRALSHTFYVEPGTHVAVASFGKDERDEKTYEARAATAIGLTFNAPKAEGPPSPRSVESRPTPSEPKQRSSTTRHRLSPVYFSIGALATAGVGATLVWSGLDVLSQNRAYEADPTRGGFDAGRGAELRTNILIGATSVLAAATIVLAVFTDWKRKQGRRGRNRTRDAALVPKIPFEVRF